jgi:hypothetical protein
VIHNLFIAIIEQGFAHIYQNPVRLGNESSDEEDAENLESVKKGSSAYKKLKGSDYIARKSKLAYKKIVNSGKRDYKMIDESTNKVLQDMEAIVTLILNQIEDLYKALEAVGTENPDYELLKQHLIDIVNYQLLPIVDYFN